MTDGELFMMLAVLCEMTSQKEISKKEWEAKMLETHPNQCPKCKVWYNSETCWGKDNNLCIKCRNDDELRNKGYVINAIEKLQCSVCGSKIFENDVCYCDANKE